MGFDSLMQRKQSSTVRKFVNCTVIASRDGIEVKSFPGVFDEHAEVVQPWESERISIKPAVTVNPEDFSGIDSAYTLEIRKLNPPEGIGKEYKLDGKPHPVAGMILVYLGAKK